MSCKTLIGARHLRIRFDKIIGFIKVYEGNRYLVLFGPKNMPFSIGIDTL